MLFIDAAYQHIPDDEVLLPTIWLEPVHPVNRPPLWGVGLEHVETHSPENAYTFRPAVRDEVDFAQLRQPHCQVDEPATAARVERARELLDDALPVKLLTHE